MEPAGVTLPRVAILGAGLAGLAAATELARAGSTNVVLFDKRSNWGGHASSFGVDGFIFDEGPHISFTKNEHIREVFADAVESAFVESPGIALNYYGGLILRHPAQYHLYPLPAELKVRCVADLVKAQGNQVDTVRTYRDWCYRAFGETFSETFVRLYTRKYWTCELEQLDTDWVGPRVQPPRIEEMLEGAFIDSQTNFNYITTFRYPKRGGFQAFGQKLALGHDIRYGHILAHVDSRTRTMTFQNGHVEQYDHLISSIPLPELIPAIDDLPEAAMRAVGQLRWTSHFLVNVGVRGKGPEHFAWMYFYDADIPFSRVSVPSNLSRGNAPEGCYSLQAEVVHRGDTPVRSPGSLQEDVLGWLQRVGLLSHRADVLCCDVRDIEYANVVFDLQRAEAVRELHAFLSSRGIAVCGRYGEWAYLWSDESICSGERVARAILSDPTWAPDA